jgi:hypothetical protein
MLRKALALALAGALLTTGCASVSGRGPMTTPSVVDPGTMADYAQKIPPGSRVRVERTAGGNVHGTLMKAGPQAITVQRNTRVPEPPLEIPLDTVTRITLEGGGTSTGKAIAIGIASGVATFFGILAIFAATFSD